ncbi:MAG: hypothetical protein VX335_05445, partial [Pseudomonadota bacterium]|nr:hypothetical protein [Pseudomonadota bacterium]
MKLYQHIKFIDNGNDFIVMAPIVRSNGISIDNTCGAKNAFQSFLGTSNKGNQGGTDIYNSLRNIIKDNEEESKKRHEEGLPQRHIYLKAVEYLKFIESMKVKLDKFSSDNCEFKKIDKSNLHTLRLGVSVASQELSFPRQTISFRGFDLTSRIGKSQIFNISGESESKSNVLDMLQKHFSDPLISQENSPVSNNDESEVSHISVLITEFESFYQMQHPKKIKLTAPTLENLDSISKLATEAEVLKKPLWKISKEPCITYKHDLSTGGLYKSVSDKDVFVVNREAVKVLCSYLKDVLLVDLNTADKFEIITYIINIFRFNIQELKPTNDLFMKIFN